MAKEGTCSLNFDSKFNTNTKIGVIGLAHGCNSMWAFPGGAYQYRVQLPSISDCVSVILPPYKTSQQVVGSAKLTPDQSH